jgi:hypothetical protein
MPWFTMYVPCYVQNILSHTDHLSSVCPWLYTCLVIQQDISQYFPWSRSFNTYNMYFLMFSTWRVQSCNSAFLPCVWHDQSCKMISNLPLLKGGWLLLIMMSSAMCIHVPRLSIAEGACYLCGYMSSVIYAIFLSLEEPWDMKLICPIL